MRLLFVTGRAHLPQSFGGVQSSTDATIARLRADGHHAAVACALWGSGRVALRARIDMKLRRRDYSVSPHNGYPVYRSWHLVDAIGAVTRNFRPDVAIVQHQDTVPFATALAAAGVPVVVYLRNLEYDELGGDLRGLSPRVRYIANSQFTAAAYRARFGIDPIVIPPLVQPERYVTEGHGTKVTMINPAPVKGVDTTLELAARCPDIPFVLVQGWGMPDDLRARVDAINAVANNITLHPATNDMQSIYADARIVLAPSRWEEAWGRIASEAHVSGIPVIGSDRGGLPEAIGPGGIVVPADAPIDDWVAALRRLWDDPVAWQSASDAARSYARRDEMQPDGQVRRLLEVAEQAIQDHKR